MLRLFIFTIVLISLVSSCLGQAKPGQVDPVFDCGIKKLAYEYAQAIQPWRGSLLSVFDALQLYTLCKIPRPPALPGYYITFKETLPTAASYYVNYNAGSDTNPGTLQSPFKTLLKAVLVSRSTPGATIYMREGIHFLNETVTLTAQNNNLVITAYNNENVIINGGILLKPTWKAYNTQNGANIWVADLSGQGVQEMLGLQLNGQRCTRARFPNANPEIDLFPEGWITSKCSYKPPLSYPPSQVIRNNTIVRTEGNNWQHWQVGIGGGCSIYTPPESFWCSEGPYGVPSGVFYPANTFSHKWADPMGGIVQMWRDAHWNSWMFEIDAYNPGNNSIGWTFGGFQGSRPSNIGAEWYVENIFEELDAPNEFFYDKNTRNLYIYYNGTGIPPATGFVATYLKVLVSVTGTHVNPVKGVTFKGLTFQNAAYTYMDPHGVPSGGDWGLQRTGAVFLEGTQEVVIENCTFSRLDGIALFLSGFNLNTSIVNNEFVWIGDTAIAAWGNTTQIDGTAGNFPRFTQLLGNLIHEIGHYEKQSSGWFQATSAQTTIKNNLIFNGPRAGINVNDGFGGGNEITDNLLFNECRESGDHGPFNSWDRIPYLTTINNGTPSVVPAYNDIHHNFFIGNYESTWNIDNDDGSAWYLNHHNVEIYAQGSKSYAQGHNKYDYENIYWCTGSCFYFFDTYTYPTNDRFYSNRAIQNYTGSYGNIAPGPKNNMVQAWNNSIYTIGGKSPTIQYWPNNTVVSWSVWQSLGEDADSKVYDYPSYDEFYGWVRALLSF
jgi:hypothetical protein